MRKQYRSGPAGQAIPCIPRTLNFGLCRVQQMPMAVHPGSCITGHVLVLFLPAGQVKWYSNGLDVMAICRYTGVLADSGSLRCQVKICQSISAFHPPGRTGYVTISHGRGYSIFERHHSMKVVPVL
jgi:hypothetical protein